MHRGGLRILVTSRERLQLQAEHVYAVPPLQREEAVSLFVTRASAVGGRVERSLVTTELCRRLDDLPLALELAAARTVLFSSEQLLHRLDRRLDLLKGPRDADPRQQTLRATISWSYDLLDEAEQRLFCRLSIFVGGCTFEAAEQVCGGEAEALQSLVDKSLIRFSNERFWMLETIRAYAKEEQERHDDVAALQLRHARYYLAFAKETKAKLRTSDRRRWVEARAVELDNLRAALGWSIESGSATLAQELVIAFSGAALVHPRELRDWIERVLGLSGGTDSVLRARVLKAGGYAALVEGNYRSARDRLAEAVPTLREAARSREVDLESEFADALAGLADIERIDGRLSHARGLFNEAIQVAERCRARHILNNAVFGLAHLEFDQENYTVSRALLLKLDVERMIWPLQALGDIAMAQGDVEAAARYYHRCLERGHAEAARRAIVYALAGLAAAASREGDHETAGRLWGAVETLNETLRPGLLPHDEPRYRRHLEGSWTNPSFVAARAEGRALSMDQAVALALRAPVTRGK
jgi:tetratricopeptide (TPR) repeat protein